MLGVITDPTEPSVTDNVPIKFLSSVGGDWFDFTDPTNGYSTQQAVTLATPGGDIGAVIGGRGRYQLGPSLVDGSFTSLATWNVGGAVSASVAGGVATVNVPGNASATANWFSSGFNIPGGSVDLYQVDFTARWVSGVGDLTVGVHNTVNLTVTSAANSGIAKSYTIYANSVRGGTSGTPSTNSLVFAGTAGTVWELSKVTLKRVPSSLAFGTTAGVRPNAGYGPVTLRNLQVLTEYQTGVANTAVMVWKPEVNFGWATTSGVYCFSDGGTTGVSLTKAFTSVTDTTYTFSMYILYDTDGPPNLSGSAASATNDFYLSLTGTRTPSTYRWVRITDRLYRVWVTYTATTTGSTSAGVLKSVTNNTRAFTVTGFQVEVGDSPTTYQRVGSTTSDARSMFGPNYWWSRWNGTTDALTVTSPTTYTASVLTVGKEGSWLDTGVTIAAGATSLLGPTTMGDSVVPSVTLVGDILGIVVRQGTFTPEELEKAVNYWKARGGRGLLTPGLELLDNSSFASDTVWIKGTEWTIASGVASHSTGTVATNLQSWYQLVAGSRYTMSVTCSSVTTSGILLWSDGTNHTTISSSLTAGTTYTATFKATTSGLFSLRAAAAVVASFDNLSLRELTPS